MKDDKRTCHGCSKVHDGSFLQDFCSESCRLVWLWRRRMGFLNPD